MTGLLSFYVAVGCQLEGTPEQIGEALFERVVFGILQRTKSVIPPEWQQQIHAQVIASLISEAAACLQALQGPEATAAMLKTLHDVSVKVGAEMAAENARGMH